MTHPEWIDPGLCAAKCTPAEIEVARLRNMRMSWTTMTQITGRSRGDIRREWASANQKVNGGYVPPPKTKEQRDHDRATRINDPDVLLGLKGIPVVGLKGRPPIETTRSGK